MALRAQEISQEAGSKMAQAMKDVINAAAGLAGFAVESARDLVQYMVRRGQMTQEEADRLIREAEEAHAKRKPVAKAPAPTPPAPAASTATAAAPKRPAAAKVAKPSAPATKSAPRPKAVPSAKKKPSSGSARAKSTTKTAAGKKKK